MRNEFYREKKFAQLLNSIYNLIASSRAAAVHGGTTNEMGSIIIVGCACQEKLLKSLR
jgi:hypothetical protein